MIAIIDYGMGNVGSIRNMLTRLGYESVMTAEPEELQAADKLILPGVGAFDNAMEALDRLDLIAPLNEQVLAQRKPILGICLGMQLLTEGSEEGKLAGLGWVAARTVRFRFQGELARLRIPHMGWNTLTVQQPHPLFADLDPASRYYFVHSYHVACHDPTQVLTTTEYGIEFHSALGRDNIVGTQFHPEKSHRFGLELLRRFAEGWS